MKIKVYASLSYEQLFEKGKKSGMDDKAADYFAILRKLKLSFMLMLKTVQCAEQR
jgi:hypothetical protein